jgi:DNA-binding MarR family transcriptional regulator
MFHDSKDPPSVHTIHLSNHDLKDAQRLLTILSQALDDELGATEHSRSSNETSANARPRDRLKLRARAAEFMRLSQKRTKYFPRAMFGEAPWEMLLALYISDTAISVGRLGDASGVATSSALRWVKYLEKENLVARDSHPTDLRRVLIKITERGRNLLDMYYSETLKPQT